MGKRGCFAQKNGLARRLKIYSANHYFIFPARYGENRIKHFLEIRVQHHLKEGHRGLLASTNLKMIVFDVKNSLTGTKMPGFGVFPPLDIIL